jgi:hypothetical protein
VRLEGLFKLKNPITSYEIEPDFPARGIVPQPNMLPRTRNKYTAHAKFVTNLERRIKQNT